MAGLADIYQYLKSLLSAQQAPPSLSSPQPEQDLRATPDSIMQVETDGGTTPLINPLKSDTPIGPAQVRPSLARELGIPLSHLTDKRQLPQVIEHILAYHQYQIAKDLAQTRGLPPGQAEKAAVPYAVAAYNIGPTAVRQGLGIRRDDSGHAQQIPITPPALEQLRRGMAYWAKTQSAKQGRPQAEWRGL